MRILIVGQNPTLNHMRARLLTPTYKVTCGPVEEAAGILETAEVDVLMICHTVSLKAAAALIQVASENQPAATVLWLSERQTSAGWIEDGGRVISIDHREQPWIKALDEILSGRQEAHAEDRPRPKDLNRPHVSDDDGRSDASCKQSS